MTLIEKLINEHNQAVQYTEESQYKDGFLSGMKKAIDIVKKHKGWISVDDRLPTEHDVYTVYCPSSLCFQHEKEQIQMVSFHPDTGWNSPTRITHWQPIPKPPKKY